MSKINLAYFVNDSVGKYSQHPDVNDIWETVWSAAPREGNYMYFPDGVKKNLDIFSSSDEDRPGGTGVHRVRVFGCDANYYLIDTDVELDGMTPVLTGIQFHRIWRMQGLEGGSAQSNVGMITAKEPDENQHVMACIEPEMGQTLMGVWTVPKIVGVSDVQLLLRQIFMNTNTDGEVFINFMVRPWLTDIEPNRHGVWLAKRAFALRGTSLLYPISSEQTKSGKIKTTLVLRPGDDIEVRARVDKRKHSDPVLLNVNFDGFY